MGKNDYVDGNIPTRRKKTFTEKVGEITLVVLAVAAAIGAIWLWIHFK